MMPLSELGFNPTVQETSELVSVSQAATEPTIVSLPVSESASVSEPASESEPASVS